MSAVITGAHVILCSSDPDADRSFLAGLLGTPSADAGGGWTMLQLPPGEVEGGISEERWGRLTQADD